MVENKCEQSPLTPCVPAFLVFPKEGCRNKEENSQYVSQRTSQPNPRKAKDAQVKLKS